MFMFGDMNSKSQGKDTTNRTLKIELAGDMFRRRTFPKIRLQGRWLERLGFRPNDRVEIVPVAEGIMNLRCVPTGNRSLAVASPSPTGLKSSAEQGTSETIALTSLTTLQLNEPVDDTWQNPSKEPMADWEI
jgi:hypothetical protein